MDELARWFMTAPSLVIFAAGVVLGVPLWMLAASWLLPHVSPYAHAQREYERARAAYQPKIRST